ncbi:MAG: hypothetical protein IKG39_07395 [Lachnospiraceae bacterium]|nr:hypothetical protein [Lachnospiraceae bacterium]
MTNIKKREEIGVLIELLKGTSDVTVRTLILQSYIQSYGPVPEEYGAIIRSLIEK